MIFISLYGFIFEFNRYPILQPRLKVNSIFHIDVLMYKNYDIQSVITPVKHQVLEQLLTETRYDKDKTRKLVNGFKHGFEIGYEGKKTGIRRLAPNLKLTVGSEIELWNKVMKEVQCK